MAVALPLAGRCVSAEGETAARLYLVGVGPGDPELITLQAARVLKESELIVCTKTPEAPKTNVSGYFSFEDKFAPYLAGKELIHVDWFVGRHYGEALEELQGEDRRKAEGIRQQRDSLIVRLRQAIQDKKTIAVICKGDPTIYEPNAWYLEEFADIDPVVIPGLSSFNAASAALRRPVTSGKHTRSVILTAGYGAPDKTDTLEKLAALRCTMVIFTMGTELPQLVQTLSAHYPPETPIAIVKHAGYAEREQAVHGTLATIVGLVGSDLPFEHLIYVGDFLSYRLKQAPTD